MAGRGGTTIGAVPLTAVALAAHQHLDAAARAQEQSGGLIGHGHLRQIPKVCWTGLSTGATIKPHPVYGTVKGAAAGTNLPVRAAAVPAYLGVGVLQRSRQIQRPARRPAASPPWRACNPATAAGRPSQRYIHCHARAGPPDRVDRHKNHHSHVHPGIKTALSKPENCGS